jgi:Sigma-70 region 2
MDDQEMLAERFEVNRAHLRTVAYQMLGSLSEADDAVQECWLHLTRSDISDVENLAGWLTTAAARVCLDMLRARKSRRALLADSVTMLDPHVILRADVGAEPAGASRVVSGAAAVAKQALAFAWRAQFAQPALVNGAAGVLVADQGQPLAVMGFTIAHGKIVEIDILADPARLRRLDLPGLDN